MKITDEQLLKLVTETQLKKYAKNALTNYIGGTIGVNGNSDSNLYFAGYMQHYEIKAEEIGRNQTLKRLRGLLEQGKLKTNRQPALGFYIESELMTEAYEAARQFWLGQGVPEGWDEQNQCMRTEKASVLGIDVAALTKQCEEMLIAKYAS